MFEDYNVGDILNRLILLKDAVHEPEEEFYLMAQFFKEPPVIQGLAEAGFVPNPLSVPNVREVDLSRGANYEVVPSDGIIVVVGADDDSGVISLLPAVGSFRKLVISVQQDTYAVDVVASSGDSINLIDTLTVDPLSTVMLLDYANGKWMVFHL